MFFIPLTYRIIDGFFKKRWLTYQYLRFRYCATKVDEIPVLRVADQDAKIVALDLKVRTLQSVKDYSLILFEEEELFFTFDLKIYRDDVRGFYGSFTENNR